jgi:hypothetical protein
MTGIEVAVGAYLFAWAKKRGKSASERAGKEADNAVDKLMDRLHRLVEDKLGKGSQPMAMLEEEAGAGQEKPGEDTTALVEMSLRLAAGRDAEFAARLAELVSGIKKAEGAADGGGDAVRFTGNTFGDGARVHIGDNRSDVHNEISGGTNFGTINQGGDMHFG